MAAAVRLQSCATLSAIVPWEQNLYPNVRVLRLLEGLASGLLRISTLQQTESLCADVHFQVVDLLNREKL